MNRNRLSGVSIAVLLWAAPALAQRVEENTVTAATDAFGLSIGGESIGIYNPDQARGLSPAAAGNLRIEGLYFSSAGDLTDRLVDGSTVAVGLTAINSPFPAPSGVADYALRRRGDASVVSIVTGVGIHESPFLEVDATSGTADGVFSIAYGASTGSEGQMFGGRGWYYAAGATPRYRPSDALEITLFAGQIWYNSYDGPLRAFTAGDYLPPRTKRGDQLTQDWSADSGRNFNSGGIIDAKFGDGWAWKTGLFFSRWSAKADVAEIMVDMDQAGVGRRLVILFSPDAVSHSLSGESRLEKTLVTGDLKSRFMLSLKGRRSRDLTGGEQVVDFGLMRYQDKVVLPEPAPAFGALDVDKVSQTNIGLGYHGEWRGIGELSLGLQRAHFRKTVAAPGQPVARGTSRPWLYNVATAVRLSERVIAYAGYTRGLEDSDSAPSNAANRGAILPAIETSQRDAGLRIGLGSMSLIAGVFDVRRPYAGLDVTNVYRYIGLLKNRGFEASLTGQPVPGLNVVGGIVAVRPRLSGEEVDRGLRNAKPAGFINWDGQLNLDYRLPNNSPWSVNGAIYATGLRRAKNDSDFNIPTRAIASIGARYRFDIGATPASLRFRVDNITNKFGWHTSGAEDFTYNGPRRWSLTLAADL